MVVQSREFPRLVMGVVPENDVEVILREENTKRWARLNR